MVLESESPKRKIHDLRVVDLRNELEKRGLDKSGVKAILIGRLSKALQDEGLNPDDYQFDISAGSATEKRTPKRGTSSRQDADTVSNPDSTLDVVDVSFSHELEEEPKEDVKEEMKNEKEEEAKNEKKADEEKAETKEDAEPENKEEAEVKKKEEEKEEAEAEKKEDRKPAEHVVQENDGVEDSINLTIEDEENFEEEEQNMKYKEATLDEQTLTMTRGGKQESSSASAAASKDELKDSTKDFRGSETMSSGPSDERDGKAQDSGPSQGERTKSATSSTANKETKNAAKEDRDKKKNGTGGNSSGRNLWVSGLASSTRATDLKYLFSKYGKVIGAKVVTNARTPGARCYGYVTMNSSEEAAKCIQHLHRTELHGRMISVERAKGGEDPSSRGDVQKSDAKPSSENVEPKTDDKPEKTKAESPVKTDASSVVATPAAASASSTAAAAKGETGEMKEEKETRDEKSGKANDKEKEELNKEKEKEKEKPRVNRDQRIRPRRPPPKSGGGPGGPRGNVLTFRHIREERERQRQRERERELRETERRRREEVANLREQERRQREEFLRLERERERLRLEREKLDREKAELLRLERETQRLERERIEREREELRRQQARSMARIEEARRATVKRPGAPMDERELLEDRKRVALDPARRYDRYDAPPSKPSSHYPVAPKAVERDYDRGRPDRYERGGGAPPPPPHHASSSSHRRVMNEPPPPTSHGRDASRGGPSSAGGGSQRERDDRRVVDRARDDRSDRDRGGRPSISGRDVYAERDRPRERVPEREPIRNRLDRDHRGERYPDPHSKSSDLRYNERGGGSGSSSLLGNGLAASHSSRDHGWGAASGERKPEPLITGGGSWSGSVQPTDRWAQPHGSLSRSVGWPSSGASLLPQMSGSMHNHSADAGGYGSDRYSRR